MEGSADVSATPTAPEGQPEATAEAKEETSTESEAVPGTKAASKDGKDPATPAEKRRIKFRAKVDGVEEEVDLDEDTIQRDYQKWRASQKKFEEAAQIRKETQEYFQELKKDKWKVFKDMGLDPVAAAEELLIERIKLDQMSPAERRAYDLEQENNRYKAELEQERSAKKQFEADIAKQKQEAVELQISADLGQEIVDAIKATGAKPSPRLVTRMAEHMLAHYTTNGTPLKAVDALKHARRTLVDDASSYLADLPLDEVKKILPKSFLDGLRKSDVEAVLAQDPVAKLTSGEPKQQQVRKALKRGNTDQIFDNLFEKRFKS